MEDSKKYYQEQICIYKNAEYTVKGYRNKHPEGYYYIFWIIESKEMLNMQQDRVIDRYLLHGICEYNSLTLKLLDYIGDEKLESKMMYQAQYRNKLINMLISISNLVSE